MKTLSSILEDVIASSSHTQRASGANACKTADGTSCGLCLGERLEYVDEVEAKRLALTLYWNEWFPLVPLDSLVPSPDGRRYRTITKRKIFARGMHLGLIAPSDVGVLQPLSIRECLIEPEIHNRIYRTMEQLIQNPSVRQLAAVLKYVVIKGNYREQTIILSIGGEPPEIKKPLTSISKRLTEAFPSITGVFSYLDNSDGRYYLGEGEPRGLRKIFGKSEIFQKINGRSFLYSPLSFSQVNQSLVGRLVQEVSSEAGLDVQSRLFDLYCGYGLFSLCLSEKAREVIGVERSEEAVQAARANAQRQRVAHARFTRADITPEKLRRLLPGTMTRDIVILDPPRSGTAPGVIETIAERRPRRILHLFCNSDIMAGEIERWRESGYIARRARPFDMFPGTPVVEFLVVFET